MVDAPNTLAVFLRGPDARARRVRRAQAELLADLSPAPRRRRAGWPACARRRARRELGCEPVVLEKGDRAGRVDAALERRRLAPPQRSRRSARECPGGDPRLQRLVVERLDDGARVARGARRAGRRARDRQPAARSACASSPRGLTEALVRAAGERPARSAARPERGGTGRARDRRLRRPSSRARARPRCVRGNPWSDGRRSPRRARPRRRDGGRPGRVLRPQLPDAAGRRGRLRARRPAVRARTRCCSPTTGASSTWRCRGRRSSCRRRSPGRAGAAGSSSTAARSASASASGPSPR